MKLKQFTFTFLASFWIALVSGAQPANAQSITVIAEGLDNARGLTVGPDGSIYVTESGVGGDGVCGPSPSVLRQPLCAGKSGAVTIITPKGKQKRIITKLPSLALIPSQTEAAGAQDIKFDHAGNAYLLFGFAGNPTTRDQEINASVGNPNPPDAVLNLPGLAKLYKVDLSTGKLTEIVDFAAYELANNPDGGGVFTNPYALTLFGDTAFVADAGANAIYSVNLDGSNLQGISIPTQVVQNPEFPPLQPGQVPPPGAPPGGGAPDQINLQSVPTGVAIGPDGYLYVSELTGFPYPEGEARIYRIGPDGKPEVFAEGFTQISDLEFDQQGNLFVLQFADQAQWKGILQELPGSLIRLAPDGTRTTVVEAGEGIVSATALAVGPDGSIYVTNKGAGPDSGEVLKIELNR